MISYHRLHNVDVKRNNYFSALQFIEVLHRLWLTICSNDDFDVFGEVLWKPKGDVALLAIVSIYKVVDPLKDEDNFVVEDI